MMQMPPADEPFSLMELQQATRNRGMPLEGLRYDITPAGLHYLLPHYAIPDVEVADWRLEVSGNLDRTLSRSMDDLRARPARTMPVTLECAGNGRSRMPGRARTQPWLLEAVST